ncbi:MAG: prepilin-type N-terminal cleavage/methylation domain-containing protein [Candidatus Riflebacteria bacterium]|nr:prepilin-type N-terminal cleavage/methylation domain-containing protein [Candidatus Riflebacteria bacterium]
MNDTRTKPKFFPDSFISFTSHFHFTSLNYRSIPHKNLPDYLKTIYKYNSDQNGVSLVEILVAISIASLVMLPIILLFGISEKVTYKSINEVVAANLALQKIEELKCRPFAELRGMIEAHAADQVEGPFTEISLPIETNVQWNSPGVEYSREARISFFPSPDPNPQQPDYELQKRRVRIRVIVHFIEIMTDGRRKEKDFELATLLGDEGLASGMNASFTTGVKP